MKQLFLLSMLFLAILTGCEKDDFEFAQDEAVIVKELPTMNIADMENGETWMIQTRAELDALLSKNVENIGPDGPGPLEGWINDLKEVDMERNTVLIGCIYTPYVGGVYSYTFEKTGKKKYQLTCTYNGMLATPGGFSYGLVVKKLHKSAKVKFKTIEKK